MSSGLRPTTVNAEGNTESAFQASGIDAICGKHCFSLGIDGLLERCGLYGRQ